MTTTLNANVANATTVDNNLAEISCVIVVGRTADGMPKIVTTHATSVPQLVAPKPVHAIVEKGVTPAATLKPTVATKAGREALLEELKTLNPKVVGVATSKWGDDAIRNHIAKLKGTTTPTPAPQQTAPTTPPAGRKFSGGKTGQANAYKIVVPLQDCIASATYTRNVKADVVGDKPKPCHVAIWKVADKKGGQDWYVGFVKTVDGQEVCVHEDGKWKVDSEDGRLTNVVGIGEYATNNS